MPVFDKVVEALVASRYKREGRLSYFDGEDHVQPDYAERRAEAEEDFATIVQAIDWKRILLVATGMAMKSLTDEDEEVAAFDLLAHLQQAEVSPFIVEALLSRKTA